VDSLLNKRTELKTRLTEDETCDIIALTEVYPKNFDIDGLDQCELNIDGYEQYVGQTSQNARRGTIIYISKDLDSQRCDVLSDDIYRESVWVTVKLGMSETLLVGCVYRSPGNSSDENNLGLIGLLHRACETKHTHLVIMGDFNLRNIDWQSWTSSDADSHFSHSFIEGLRYNYLHQHVLEPTRFRANQSPSLADLILTCDENLINDVMHRAPVGKSDHVVLQFNIECCADERTHSEKYIYHKGDYTAMNNRLEQICWEDELNRCTTVDEMCGFVTKEVQQAIQKYIPTAKSRTSRRKRKPLWMDRQTSKAIKRKNKAWSRFSSNRDPSEYTVYARHRNAATTACREAKQSFEKRLSCEVSENPKAFWRYVSSKTKTRTGIGDLVKDDDTLTVSDHEKAEVLNRFFCSVFTKEDSGSIPTLERRNYISPLEDFHFSEKDVMDLLSALNASKSAGPDGFHPRVLKECSKSLSKPLYAIMRTSLDTGHVPLAWKEANITAIFKKGRKQDAGNYRPISLTPVVCKLFEGIVRKNLIAHMDANDLFTDHQHGFRNKRSTVTQLLQTMEDWTKALDENKPVDIIYLDFQKAFDTVPHLRLANKLHAYGIQGNVHRWILSFLDNRRQRVCVNGSFSEWSPVTSGIPQGSVLGPILFVTYINDMPDTVSSMCKLFADDTKLYRAIEQSQDIEVLQDDLFSLSGWSDEWLLRFNASKCKRMHLGSTNTQHEYMLSRDSESALDVTTAEKDLGVFVDPDLSFRKHINTIVNKANRIIGIIKRTFDYRDSDMINRLYCSLVRPHLEYANSVWAPRLRKDINAIENVQRRATKTIPELSQKSYTERLTSLQLYSLAYRRRRGDMIHVFKMLHGLENGSDLFTVSDDSRTRGHSLKLVKQRCNKNTRLQFFASRVVNDWNSLPEPIVHAPSVNSFKHRLDQLWEEFHYVY
jgi:hypothetical protein